MGDIVIFCQGVSFPGRYGHRKPTKPVNTALLALHRFQSYIISVCFQGYFYISGDINICSGVLLPDSIYSQAKVGYYHGNSDTNRQNSVLSRKEDRSCLRGNIKQLNQLLVEMAYDVGVISNEEFAIFQNAGYHGFRE